MFRLIFVVFHGRNNVPADIHPHEPAWYRPLILPLVLLAIPAVFIGFVGVPPDNGAYHNFIEPVFAPALARGQEITAGFTQPTLIIMLISTMVAIGGIFTAFLLYYRPNPIPAVMARNLPWLYNAILHKWYFDEFYDSIVVNGGKAVAYGFWRFDQRVVDGLVNGVAGFVRGSGGRLRRVQTGFVQGYALAIGIGLLGLVTYLWIILPK
jgi:NADH-quinone oxidoreductase subunit L